MNRYNLKSSIGNFTPQKRRGVAEVISSLLLVVITVVGAVILTTFIDESFVAGGLAVTSGTDTTIKTIKLVAYDTRDGVDLMGYDIDNEHTINLELCRENCVADTHPTLGGSDFLIFQIENRGINPIYLTNIYLDSVNHLWDPTTDNIDLIGNAASPAGGVYPSDGTFSILSDNINDPTQGNKEIEGGETVNVLIKLHSADPTISDIKLSKTMRVELNISEASLVDFLIETGDTR